MLVLAGGKPGLSGRRRSSRTTCGPRLSRSATSTASPAPVPGGAAPRRPQGAVQVVIALRVTSSPATATTIVYRTNGIQDNSTDGPSWPTGATAAAR